MSTKIFVIGLMVACVVISGCVTTQTGTASLVNASASSLDKQLLVDVTTKDEVEKLFGAPTSIKKNILDENNPTIRCDVWIYQMSQTSDNGARNVGRATSLLGFIPGVGIAAGAASVATNAVNTNEWKNKRLEIYFNQKTDRVFSYYLENNSGGERM